MKLIIVESPHKSKTISGFLGSEYKVLASKGHIRDLASSGKMGLGVDVEHGFTPTYAIKADSKETVKELKAAVKKADEVYLATDPDREGEAISWHLCEVLGLDPNTTKRLEFHEITKSAIAKALANPGMLNMPLVESQETRRIIDRIMGFRLTYLLKKKCKSQSVGRVQSVVLRFIVDRENEIRNFVPVEYWTIKGLFENQSQVEAELSSYKDAPITVPDEKTADEIIAALPDQFVVKSVKVNEAKRDPAAPFITSTLQQAAYSSFHMATARTASVAQRLYEGVEIAGNQIGLITYMRTDSIRLAEEFVSAARGYIAGKYGKEYLGFVRKQAASKNVQDAHEAIRPTDINMTPEMVKNYLSTDEYKLYSLIYERTIASLMAPKKEKITTVVLSGNDYDFTASSSAVLFDGYSKIYKKYEEEEEKKESLIPQDIKEGDLFEKKSIEKTQHFTKAPNRYNEGRIVKLMQENGIGRPSTYASTISTLKKRDHIEDKKGLLNPTTVGEITTLELKNFFPEYIDEKYTAEMETNLDQIAEQKIDKDQLLTDFWNDFLKLYDNADEHMPVMKEPDKLVDGRVCPECGKPLAYKKGRFGTFIGCSDYPHCKYKEKPQVTKVEGHVCPRCGKDLLVRKGKKGEFVGCSGFPKCTYMETLEGEPIVQAPKVPVVIPEDAPLCPRCHTGRLIEKKSERRGTTFIGCSNFPKCRYIQRDASAPAEAAETPSAAPKKKKTVRRTRKTA